MSLSAHKTYGPKGVGALYVRRKPRVRIEAQIHGGGHERGMRSGTLPTHQIVGMGEAFRLAGEHMVHENERIRALRDRLLAGLQAIPEVLRERRHGTPRAAQPEHQLPVRRRRIAADGHEGGRGVVRARPAPRPAWSPATCCARWACPTRSRTARSASRSAASPPRPTSTRRSQLSRQTVERLRSLSPLWDMHVRPASTSPACSGPRTDQVRRPILRHPSFRTHRPESRHGIQRKGHRPLRAPAQRRRLRRRRRRGRHRHGRRAGLRRRDEAADQGQPQPPA
jgi:hypothetical protein